MKPASWLWRGVFANGVEHRYWSGERLVRESEQPSAFWDYFDPNEHILMRFIGRCDDQSPKTPIFEGDIITATVYDDRECVEPLYTDTPLVVIPMGKRTGYWPFTERGVSSVENIKIIGNVFENPELVPKTPIF